MIRASLGNVVNYATTFAFQILFASRYGSSHAAAGFIVVFGLGVAATGILVSSLQSAVMPRLIAPSGGLLGPAVRFLVITAGSAVGIGWLVFLAAGDAAQWLSYITHLDVPIVTDLVRISAPFIVLQILSGELITVALARGDRVIPTLAPAFPSALAALGLLVSPELGVRQVFLLLAAGSLIEVVFLVALVRRPIDIVSAPSARLGSAVALMAFTYMLLSFIPPYERIAAARVSAASAAQLDYGLRSLRAAQQLVLGGVFLAALGNWSASAIRGLHSRTRQSLAATVTLASNILIACSSVALVSAHPLVALIFQRGKFTAHDTDAVSAILLLAIPGFWSEGTGLVITSMLAAMKKNVLLAGVATTSFVLRFALISVLSLRWGAPGVAAAYSIGSLAMLIALAAITIKLSLFSDGLPILRKGSFVGVGTLAVTIATLLLFRGRWQALEVLAVLATFGLLFRFFQPAAGLRLLPK